MKKIIILLSLLALASAALAATPEQKWLRYANKLYKSGKLDLAIKAYNNVLKLNPNNKNAMYYLAYSYLKAGDGPNALKFFRMGYEKTGDKRFLKYLKMLEEAASAFGLMGGSYIWQGGQARIAGTGGQEIVLPDNTSVIDLYSDGFISGFTSRPQRDLAHSSPCLFFPSSRLVYDLPTNPTEQRGGWNLLLNSVSEHNNGLIYWFDKDSVMILKPHTNYGGEGFKESNDSSGITNEDSYSTTVLGGFAEYARKIGSVSAGALLGYSVFNVGFDDEDTPDKYGENFYKLEFLASVSAEFPVSSGKIGVAISGGRKAPMFPELVFKINELNPSFSQVAMMYNMYSSDSWSHSETASTITDSNVWTDMSWLDAGAGISAVFPDLFELAIKGGIRTGITGHVSGQDRDTDISTGDVTITDATEFDRYSDGTAFNLNARARGYIGEFVVIGALVKLYSLGTNYRLFAAANPEEATMSIFDVAGGVTLKLMDGIISIPIEPFMQRTNSVINDLIGFIRTDTNIEALGIRGGAEVNLGALSFRAGVDFATGGATEITTNTFTDAVISDNSPYGTDTNPGYNQLGINFGAGIKGQRTEININFRILSISQSPLHWLNSAYEKGGFSVMLDIRKDLEGIVSK